jgi:hypothetical protein
MTILAFLLAQFVLFPMKDKLNRLETAVKTKEKDLSELKPIVSQYKSLNPSEAERAEIDRANFNLFSVLEKVATKSGLMDKLDYMKPGTLQLDSLKEEKWVEVKLSRITLKELADYLYNLQTLGKTIYIKRLSTRRDGDYLSLILQPAVVEMK